jgi:hypothetical protein
MNPADSDALAQTASLKMLLTTVGYDYLLHRQVFEEFLDAIVGLADQVPSLAFHCRTDAQIELTYLGQRFCIRHRFDREKKISVLSSMSKASPEDGSFSPMHTLVMDKTGNLARPNDKPLWSVRGGSERAFYYLLLGQ